jgi:hypothetical protein
MEVVKQLTKEELTKLQELVGKINQTQAQVGGLEAQKHELLKFFSVQNEELGVFQKELEEVYGNVSIDIQTGDIK